MKKLTKTDSATLSDLVVRLELEGKGISDAVEALREKVNAYNDVLAEAREFRDDMVGGMEDYMSERSEKWTEGDAGQAYAQWKDEWEALELDDIDDPEGHDDLAHRDLLENISLEPGGV